MSIAVTTVAPTGRELRFHNGFASFMDAVLEGTGVPARLFAQGCCVHPTDPGDLSPEQSVHFAEVIESFTDGELEDRMRGVRGVGAGDPNMKPAIAMARDLAELARFAASHGGLHVY